MKTLGYYNGKIDEIENMTVPMNDRACWFGDGVYDATYCRNRIIYALDEHIDRIFNSAAILGIVPPCSKKEMADILNETVKMTDSGDLFVYWQITRGTENREHAFPTNGKSNLWITLTPSTVKDTYEKISVTHTEDYRFQYCNVKTLNLIPSVLAAQKSAEKGTYECIFHRGDVVTECAHSNVHIIKDGKFITHPADRLILPGIARAHLIAACKDLEIEVEERPFTMGELMAADEIIVSSSGAFCMQVSDVDNIPVGNKAPELLKKLQDAVYSDYVEKTGGQDK